MEMYERLDPPPLPLGAYVINGRPLGEIICVKLRQCTVDYRLGFIVIKYTGSKYGTVSICNSVIKIN